MMKNLAVYLCLLASGVLTACSATSSSRSLRGGKTTTKTTTTTEPELLAHVEVTPNATVDMLLTEDGFFVVSAQASEEDFGLLEAAMENAQPEQDAKNFAAFYQKLAGTEHVPEELVQLTEWTQLQQQQQHDLDEDEIQDDDDDDDDVEENIDIDNNAKDALVEFDGDDDNDETRRRRLAAFCTYPYGNIGNCRCLTYRTGNDASHVIYDTWMYSHVSPYRGSVRHTIAASTDALNWSVAITRTAIPGFISTIKATNTNGFNTYFKAYTTYAFGNGYHWRYC